MYTKHLQNLICSSWGGAGEWRTLITGRCQQKSHWLRGGRAVSHKERPGYGKFSQAAVIKSYCHSTLLTGRLTIVFLEFYLPACLCCNVLWALNDVLRSKAGKTQSATFEPAQVKNKNIDLQTWKGTATQKGLQRETAGQMWSVEWSSCQQNHHLRERDREKGTIFSPYSLVNGKSECHERQQVNLSVLQLHSLCWAELLGAALEPQPVLTLGGSCVRPKQWPVSLWQPE